MVTAKCNRCLGSGTGETFKEASSKINHAVGLTRGVPCGPDFKRVIEVGASTKPKAKKTTPKSSTKSTPKASPKSATPISKE